MAFYMGKGDLYCTRVPHYRCRGSTRGATDRHCALGREERGAWLVFPLPWPKWPTPGIDGLRPVLTVVTYTVPCA